MDPSVVEEYEKHVHSTTEESPAKKQKMENELPTTPAGQIIPIRNALVPPTTQIISSITQSAQQSPSPLPVAIAPKPTLVAVNSPTATTPPPGEYCHQCHARRENATCCSACQMKYCPRCLHKYYEQDYAVIKLDAKWMCPRCRGLCLCAACRKKRGIVIEKEPGNRYVKWQKLMEFNNQPGRAPGATEGSPAQSQTNSAETTPEKPKKKLGRPRKSPSILTTPTGGITTEVVSLEKSKLNDVRTTVFIFAIELNRFIGFVDVNTIITLGQMRQIIADESVLEGDSLERMKFLFRQAPVSYTQERRVRLSECIREIGGNQSIEVTLNRETKLSTKVEAPILTVVPVTAADAAATLSTPIPMRPADAPIIPNTHGHSGDYNIFV